jgi:DNA-directed RNA polymerase-3 subunit RPC5
MPVQVKAEPQEVSSSVENDAAAKQPSVPVSNKMVLDDDDDEEEDDEEDEIVREIDVFLSPELSSQLYLMQFPLQQQSLSNPAAARLKPHHCMMELDFQTPSNMEEYGQFHMVNRTYSSATIPVITHMTLGKMMDDHSLYLIPLPRIVQMRPNFAHVDEATSNATATTDDVLEQQQRDAEQAKSLEQRKPLNFQKKESERAELARKSSYGYKKASEESELWIPLDVHPKGSPEMMESISKVLCPNPEESLLMDKKQTDKEQEPLSSTYVHSLNYLPLAYRSHDKEEGAEEVSSICTKLVQLMQLGWPIPYSVLRAQFPKSVSDETLFEALNSCAFFVRGNFILQSRLIPLPATVTQARTFMLFLFQTMEVVHRSRLEHVYEGDDQVNSEAILLLLEQIGKKTNEGWKLKVDDDASFAENYPMAIPIHLDFWRNQVRRFGPLLERYGQQPSR